VAGESRARSLGNEQAVREAWEVGARIDYDTTAQAPTYRYFAREEDGRAVEHEVWFEDARSTQAMLSLVPEFGLNGIGIWNLMRPFVGMWLVLSSEYTIRRVLE
jgi:spore germination protein